MDTLPVSTGMGIQMMQAHPPLADQFMFTRLRWMGNKDTIHGTIAARAAGQPRILSASMAAAMQSLPTLVPLYTILPKSSSMINKMWHKKSKRKEDILEAAGQIPPPSARFLLFSTKKQGGVRRASKFFPRRTKKILSFFQEAGDTIRDEKRKAPLRKEMFRTDPYHNRRNENEEETCSDSRGHHDGQPAGQLRRLRLHLWKRFPVCGLRRLRLRLSDL